MIKVKDNEFTYEGARYLLHEPDMLRVIESSMADQIKYENMNDVQRKKYIKFLSDDTGIDEEDIDFDWEGTAISLGWISLIHPAKQAKL